MPPVLRKAALTLHVAVSVSWLGAALAFLVLAVTALTTPDAQVAHALAVAMDRLTRFALVPLALAALLGGLVQALGTPWGLLRHYWVLVKLALTVFATVILLLQVAPIRALAEQDEGHAGTTRHARLSSVVHSAGGSLVLLVITGLSVFKPRGTTGLGGRRERRVNPPAG